MFVIWDEELVKPFEATRVVDGPDIKRDGGLIDVRESMEDALKHEASSTDAESEAVLVSALAKGLKNHRTGELSNLHEAVAY